MICKWCADWIEPGDQVNTHEGPMHEWCRDAQVEEETATLHQDDVDDD